MNKKKLLKYFTLLGITANFTACSIGNEYFTAEQSTSNTSRKNILSNNNRYLKSGQVILSYQVPSSLNTTIYNSLSSLESSNFGAKENKLIELVLNSSSKNSALQAKENLCSTTNSLLNTRSYNQFAPLVGFFPITAMFKPADNEVWIGLNKSSKVIEIYKGQEKIKEIKGEGEISLAPGEYPLQHKQRNPLWYAPDEYFTKRELKVPPKGDHFRYRRGALGPYALYPTMDFIIHSGPFWSNEVGGFKVEESDLASVFLMLNTGTTIVVK